MPSQQNNVAEDVFHQICSLALAYPGVERSTSYRTPSLKVKGKFMARLRTEAEGWLAIRCDFVDRQMLLQAAPEVFHVTDHYRDYPAVLIDLQQVRADALPDIVERAWRLVATPAAVRKYDTLQNQQKD